MGSEDHCGDLQGDFRWEVSEERLSATGERYEGSQKEEEMMSPTLACSSHPFYSSLRIANPPACLRQVGPL
jgi:hypothetical protein